MVCVLVIGSFTHLESEETIRRLVSQRQFRAIVFTPPRGRTGRLEDVVEPLGVIAQAAIRLETLRAGLVNPILPVQAFIQVNFKCPTCIRIPHSNHIQGQMGRTVCIIGHQTSQQCIELFSREIE